MYRGEFLYRFQFYNDCVLYHDIEPKMPDVASSIANGEMFLPFVSQPPMFKFNAESLFIQTLKEARAHPPMHFNGSANDLVR